MENQIIKISPEGLEVATTYLQTLNLDMTANTLGIPIETINEYISKREVRAYIDNVFMTTGYNNKFKLAQMMDDLIDQKLAELDEAEIGSSKDIAELLIQKHRMIMDEIKAQIELEKLKTNNSTQHNTQINNYGDNYAKLMSKLVKGDT